MVESSDGAAVTIAEHTIRDLLARDRAGDHGLLLPDAEDAARRIVGAYTVTFDRREGLRRLVLVGDWEVDGGYLADQPALIAAETGRSAEPEPNVVTKDGCDDCSVEPGETHRYPACPGNQRALARLGQVPMVPPTTGRAAG